MVVLSAMAIVPSAPVVIPELSGDAAVELADLRDAMVAVAAALPVRWVAVGVGNHDEVVDPGAVGTFGGYGSDVRVALSPDTLADARPLPLCALITGWLRGLAAPQARAEVRAYAHDLTAAAAIDRGTSLRTEIDALVEPVGILVVADGFNTLTPSAPGGYDPASVPAQAALDAALSAGDTDALLGLADGAVGRVALRVLAGLAGSGPASSREYYRAAPYGVGYFVGSWLP